MATSISTEALDRLYGAVRDVPDFPKPGIVFKDITPLLLNHDLFSQAVSRIADAFRRDRVEKVLAIESRGFIFGAPVANTLHAGLALARKMGKLPWDRHRVEYALEYGTDVIEIHKDAILPGERVLIIDDVLATGGTAKAAAQIVREAGGVLVGLGFLVELSFLEGRLKLTGEKIWSLLSFPRAD